MEEFRAKYGHYPRIDAAMSTGPASHYVIAERFAVALTGRHLDGRALSAADDDEGNTRRMEFYGFAQSELSSSVPPQLWDAFCNTQIAVLYDTNGDGVINLDDLPHGTIPPVSPAGDPTKHLLPPGIADDLKKGIPQKVIFYSAGKGGSDKDVICSWQ